MKGAAAAPLIFEEGSLRLREPAAPPLGDLAFTFQAGKNAVEVVLLDPHLRRELGDGDAGLPFHEGQRLGRAGATAFATAGTPGTRPLPFESGWLAGRFHPLVCAGCRNRAAEAHRSMTIRVPPSNA